MTALQTACQWLIIFYLTYRNHKNFTSNIFSSSICASKTSSCTILYLGSFLSHILFTPQDGPSLITIRAWKNTLLLTQKSRFCFWASNFLCSLASMGKSPGKPSAIHLKTLSKSGVPWVSTIWGGGGYLPKGQAGIKIFSSPKSPVKNVLSTQLSVLMFDLLTISCRSLVFL